MARAANSGFLGSRNASGTRVGKYRSLRGDWARVYVARNASCGDVRLGIVCGPTVLPGVVCGADAQLSRAAQLQRVRIDGGATSIFAGRDFAAGGGRGRDL